MQKEQKRLMVVVIFTAPIKACGRKWRMSVKDKDNRRESSCRISEIINKR